MMSNLNQNKSNFKLLVTGLLLLMITAIHGCKTAAEVPSEAHIKLSQPWIFNSDFQKAVYKTNMLVYGNELTGLTLIKKTKNDYHVVFMSEVGLKYFDMEFFTQNDSIKVHYVISLLDKKTVVDMLKDDLKLIFLMFPEKTEEKFYTDPMTQSMVKEYKHKRVKSRYTFNRNFGQVSTIHKKFGGSNLVISLNSFDHLAPQTININQRNLNLRFDKIEP